MSTAAPSASPRRAELLERSYRYLLEHGLGALSLRPLAAAIGTSPRVLLFLFGSKDELTRALLARAREHERDELRRAWAGGRTPAAAAAAVWQWLCAPQHRALLVLWTDAYARSLAEPRGPWAGFAEATVRDWLTLLAGPGLGPGPGPDSDPEPGADSGSGSDVGAGPDEVERTLTLAVLRGGLLDLLATGDVERVGAAVRRQLDRLGG